MLSPGIRIPIAISLGAIAGALCRYYVTLWFANRTDAFPLGTLTVNLVGAFVLGIFVTLVRERGMILSPDLALMISVGFLGSLTTFSTFELDTMNLLRDRTWLLAMAYWGGSATLGFLCLYVGMVVGRLRF